MQKLSSHCREKLLSPLLFYNHTKSQIISFNDCRRHDWLHECWHLILLASQEINTSDHINSRIIRLMQPTHLYVGVGRQESVEDGSRSTSLWCWTNCWEFLASLGSKRELITHEVRDSRQRSLNEVVKEINRVLTTLLLNEFRHTLPDSSISTASKRDPLIPFGCCNCFKGNLEILDAWFLILDYCAETWSMFKV